MNDAHRLLCAVTFIALMVCLVTALHPVAWNARDAMFEGLIFFAVSLMMPFFLVWLFVRYVKTDAMVLALCGLNASLLILWLALFVWNQTVAEQDIFILTIVPLYGLVLAGGGGVLAIIGDIFLRRGHIAQKSSIAAFDAFGSRNSAH